VEGGGHEPKNVAAYESWKTQETVFQKNLQKGIQLHQHPDFILARSRSDF
jgi:hypothetical protein